MAKIVPNQVFLDGRDRFEPGQEYEVDDVKAYYFGANGWLVDTSAPAGEATLEVDTASHGHEAQEG
jgi:hypothetical protein